MKKKRMINFSPLLSKFIITGNILAVFFLLLFASCKKEKKESIIEPDPSDNLALDSIVASKTNIIVWEEISLTAYARGENLSYKWSANHGTMLVIDSVTVNYYACYSCIGVNTIKCEVSNEFGTVSDTIMITVRKE